MRVAILCVLLIITNVIGYSTYKIFVTEPLQYQSVPLQSELSFEGIVKELHVRNLPKEKKALAYSIENQSGSLINIRPPVHVHTKNELSELHERGQMPMLFRIPVKTGDRISGVFLKTYDINFENVYSPITLSVNQKEYFSFSQSEYRNAQRLKRELFPSDYSLEHWILIATYITINFVLIMVIYSICIRSRRG